MEYEYSQAQIDRIAQIAEMITAKTGNANHPIKNILNNAIQNTHAYMDFAAEVMLEATI